MSASSKKKLRKEQKAAAMTEKQQKELKEAKKLKAYTLTFAVIMILVVAIVIGVVVRAPISGAIDRSTHAITVGEHKLSTTDLSYFYVDAINNYCDEIYSQYYSLYGSNWQIFLPFDTDKPLNQQVHSKTEGTTWADYFMDKAIEGAKSAYGLYDMAMSVDHKLTEDQQKSLDSYFKNLDIYAQLYYGVSNAKSYLRNTYGDGANVDTYKNYYTVSTIASSYYQAYAESLEYTDEDYRAYEKGKFNNYSSFTYAVYQIDVEDYLTEGTKDENGKITYTEEQVAFALAAAKKDAETLLSSGADSVEKFDKAIKALGINKDKKDAASTQNSNVFYTNIYNTDIQNWIGNSNRKAGDITSIAITQTKTNEDKTSTLETTGYYVVLYLDREDNYTNLVDVRHILIQFEGGTKDSSGNVTYSDAEKADAKKRAEALLEAWKAGKATSESFGELANLNSADSDGKDGGLYEDVYPGYTVPNFNDWCFDESRKPGDTGIIETQYGYHIMYFVKTQDITYRDYMIKNELVNKDATEWNDKISEAVNVTEVDMSRMEWDYTFN